jgi:hypothetical protein
MTAPFRFSNIVLTLALASCGSGQAAAPSADGSRSQASSSSLSTDSSGSSNGSGSSGGANAGGVGSRGNADEGGSPSGSSAGGNGDDGGEASSTGSGSSGSDDGGSASGSTSSAGDDASNPPASNSSSSGGDAGGDASSPASAGNPGGTPFTCNLLVGPSPMYQWFNGGFLTYPGIDATRWELIMVAHHYTNAWAVPGDSAWNTPVSHPCAQNSATPDRIAFMATQWTENTSAEWEADFTGIIQNILTKWPMVKRIELMPSTSTPGDVPCPGNGAESSETIIPAYGYAAIDAMPAKYPGLVFSTPHFEVPNCSDFINNGGAPQYAPNANATSGPAITDVVGVFGAYYAAHP